MRTASKWVMVAAVALSVAGMAAAQNPGGGRGGRGGAGGGQGGQGRGGMGMGGGAITVAVLLANEGVQKEIKLTDDQKTKVKEFSDAQMAKMREAFGGGGAPDQEKMAEVRKAATEAGDKFVKDTLNADQQKRITQIKYQAMLQVMGPAALSNEEVVKALTITDDQKTKFKSLADDMRKDRTELQGDLRGGGDAATEARKKIATITKDYTAKAVDTLTTEQKKTWSDLTGDKFEYVPATMAGGRGGRGGAGGGAGGGRGGRGGNNPPPPV
jgi:Spy/CpxP family protein refolding chaperone